MSVGGRVVLLLGLKADPDHRPNERRVDRAEEEDRRVAEEQERKRIGEKKSRGCVSSRGRQRREVAEQMEEWRLKAVEEEEKRAQN